MNEDSAIGFILAILSSIAMGVILGMTMQKNNFHTEAIEHGFAKHNEKTGEWEWRKAKDGVVVERGSDG